MNDLNSFVEAYEEAQALGTGALADFLPDRADPLYAAVLRELVRVDLEYGWIRGTPRALEDYQKEFPDLFQQRDAVQELALEDFRLRCQAGQNPAPDEYRQRFQIDPTRWPIEVFAKTTTRPAAPAPTVGNHDAAWEILDRFLKEMQNCDRPDEQIQLVLEAVRDSLEADAVFHCVADSSTAAVEMVGPENLSTQWCREFAQEALQRPGMTSDHLLLSASSLPTLPYGPKVESAAFLRISKSGSSWVIALSFGTRRFEPTDMKVMILARRMLLGQRQYTQTYAKLKDALYSLIHCMTAMIDARDPYTCGHSERVARIALRLGKQMGLPGRMQSDLYLAGLLHDVGKIGIRDEVLRKQGKLTEEEFAHIQQHVVIGDRIVATVKQLASLQPGVRNHHERFDGKGYPDGLAGTKIPLMARILAIADSCDAMMSARPYRTAMPTQQIDAIMKQGAGTQWDAELIEHFMACRHELYAICQRGLGQSVLHAVGQVLLTPEGSMMANTSLQASAAPEMTA